MKAAAVILLLCIAVGAQDTPHHFWDRKNITLHSAAIVLMAIDLGQSRSRIASGNWREDNPLARPFMGSNGGAVGIGIISAVGPVGISWWAHRSGHHRIERLIPAGYAASSGVAIAHNNQ